MKTTHRAADPRRTLLVGLAALTAACSSPDEQPAVIDAGETVGSAAAEYPTPEGAWELHRVNFERYLQNARQQNVAGLPIGERMTVFGREFVGLPYVAHTLELSGPERLVVNLKELDCVTLVENALALARATPRAGSFDEFLRVLERVRYRDGRIDGYTSRLHYFSDWLLDAERKGLVRNVTREIGGEPYNEPIHFMTSNRDSYRQLREDPGLVEQMRAVEQQLNAAELYWIPQDRIASVAERIREGDIIAITTAIDGLDVSHTGLATWVDGRLHLLHAPDVGQPVEVSTRPLADRIRGIRLQTGIMVARPTEG